MASIVRDRRRSNLLLSFLNSSTKRSLQTLAYEVLRSSQDRPHDSTALVLHGLLGSSRNWRSFSRALLSSLSGSPPHFEWRAVLVDQRNHGKSAEIHGLNPPNDMRNAAEDLANLVKAHGWSWPEVVIGHSMGGKVAMQFAESCARGDYGESVVPPRQLWVLDSVPGEVDKKIDGEVEKVLQTLKRLPSRIPSRKWLVDNMIELGFSRSLSEWIGTNLKRSEQHETWSFNLEGAIEMFDSYRETCYWKLLENPPAGMDINIVRAEKSDRWSLDVVHRLENVMKQQRGASQGTVSVHVLPNAGHWVHVDNPKGLLDIMAANFMLPKT